MASSNQTATYKLCQWVENDPVLREDFNADNQKLESALMNLQAAVNHSKVVVGEYSGTGFSTTATIQLGFRPKLVLVLSHGESNGGSTRGALSVGASNEKSLVLTSNGFQVCGYQNATDTEVSNSNPYRYLAFRG